MTVNENFVNMKNEFHVMSILSCFIILGTNFMKSFDIIFKWRKKKDQNIIIIQKIHQIEIKIIKIQSFLIKKINSIKFAFVISFAIKKATMKSFRKRRINVYAKKSIIF